MNKKTFTIFTIILVTIVLAIKYYDLHKKQFKSNHKKEWQDSNHITKILDYLYLGDGVGSRQCQHLNEHGINSVINMAPSSDPTQCFNSNNSFLDIDIHDSLDVNISQYFPKTYQFIENNHKRGNKILVHCHAGISRSASIVIAYLMKKNNWSYTKAFEFVKQKRSIVKPNKSFTQQLISFENLKPISNY